MILTNVNRYINKSDINNINLNFIIYNEKNEDANKNIHNLEINKNSGELLKLECIKNK